MRLHADISIRKRAEALSFNLAVIDVNVAPSVGINISLALSGGGLSFNFAFFKFYVSLGNKVYRGFRIFAGNFSFNL